MAFLRIFLLVAVLAAFVAFALLNNRNILADLGFVKLDIWQPLLVLVPFLIGVIPTWMWLAASRLRVRRRLRRVESELAVREHELAEARVELLRPPAANGPDIGSEASE